MEITVELVQELINEQFSQWKDLEIKMVKKSGHDNRTFHLGDKMSVRLPSGKDYEAQVEKENKWLPYLSKHLPYLISCPIAIGKPNKDYPYAWSINKWLEGESLDSVSGIDKIELAKTLAHYLTLLQKVDPLDAPKAGKHNFYRGGDLEVYHEQTLEALEQLKDVLPIEKLNEIFNQSLESKWNKSGVFVHGDVAPGNLLIQNNKLVGLIDFGILGVGDPACDYAMAWTYFNEEERKVFLANIDVDTINRARGWALWKALITYNSTNLEVRNNAHYTINEILNEK